MMKKILGLPSAPNLALGKDEFAECQIRYTRQIALRAPHTRSLGIENEKKTKQGFAEC